MLDSLPLFVPPSYVVLDQIVYKFPFPVKLRCCRAGREKEARPACFPDLHQPSPNSVPSTTPPQPHELAPSLQCSHPVLSVMLWVQLSLGGSIP